MGQDAASDNGWVSVGYGNGVFVAVSSTGSGDRVMTSPDGVTWTSRTSAADNLWRSVTYAGRMFVAVAGSGQGSRVMTSGTFTTTYTVTYAGNGSTGGTVPVDDSSPYAAGDTVTVMANTGTLVKSGYTFAGWNTAADGTGTAYLPAATFDMPAHEVTMFAQWQSRSSGPGATQLAVGGCVTAGSATSMPHRGSKRLMKPQCQTNANQRVGVKVSARQRGDQKYYSLGCVTGKKSLRTTSTGYGDNSRFCKRGALVIRTHGAKIRLTVSWVAPETTGFAAFLQRVTYRT